MDLYYRVGQIITLGDKGFYTIRTIIGRGSSSVVYLTDYADESGNVTEHILKEYNPKQHNLRRDETGFLSAVNETDSALFTEGQLRFESGMKKQLELRRCDELKNYTSNIQKSIHANGTIYIDMTVTSGTAYQNVQEKSLYDLMRRMKVLTHVIGIYHKKGYLHLDIKPENIYVRPENETCEDVLLFDFDSVTAKNDISNNALLSYTQQWAAMEQILPNRRNRICEATDLFAIGEIIFFKLTGRHSENTERSALTEFGFDYSSRIFENVNPKVMPLLTELFGKTLCNSVNRRYQKADELEEQLDRIISLCDPQKPYLKSTLPSRPSFFVGREKEVEEIHNKLAENDIVFLSGVGGIGKSELAKYYAHEYKDCYDTIVFAPIVDGIFSMIISDTILPIHNFFSEYDNLCPVGGAFSDDEKYNILKKQQEYYSRKIKKLIELCDEKTLIIVDNLDDEDEKQNDLMDLGCKLLITTRMSLSDEFPRSQIIVDKINNPFDVFMEYYKKPLSEAEVTTINEIVEIIGGHTLTVELLAKQMMAGRIKPQEMLERIKEGGIGRSGREKIRRQRNISGEQSVYGHIRALFDLSKLVEEQKYILSSLALIPYCGISAEKFCKWCELDNYDSINNLVHQGWIKHDEARDYISVHSVLGEIILNNAVFYGESIPLLNNLLDFISKNNYLTIWTIDENGQLAVYHSDDYDEYYDVLPRLIIGITQNLSKLIGYKKQKMVYLEKSVSLLYGKEAIENSLAAKNVILATDPDNSTILFKLYSRLSLSYEETNDIQRMVKYQREALNLAESIWDNNKSLVAWHYCSFGHRMTKLGIPGAKEYLLKALKFAESDCPSDKRCLLQIYKALGDVIMHEDTEKSEEYYKLALKNATGYIIVISQEYQAEPNLYKALIDFANVFESNGKFLMGSGEVIDDNMFSLKMAAGYMKEIIRECHINSNLHDVLYDFAKIFMSYGQLLYDSGIKEEARIYFHMADDIRMMNISKTN